MVHVLTQTDLHQFQATFHQEFQQRQWLLCTIEVNLGHGEVINEDTQFLALRKTSKSGKSKLLPVKKKKSSCESDRNSIQDASRSNLITLPHNLFQTEGLIRAKDAPSAFGDVVLQHQCA